MRPLHRTLALVAFLSIPLSIGAAGCGGPLEFRGRDGSYGVISTTARAQEKREVVIELFGSLVQRSRALVAWALLPGPPATTRRLGPLSPRAISHVENQGLLRTDVPSTPCDVLITVEDSPDVERPSTNVVATAHLQ